MYTEQELRYARNVIRRIAREHKTSEAQVRAEMMEAIRAGRANSSASAGWATFHYAGAEPTVEEWILWAAAQAATRRL